MPKKFSYLSKSSSQKYKISPQIKKRLGEALLEDVGSGDKTSDFLISGEVWGKAKIISKESGIFFGEAVIRELFKISDPKVWTSVKVLDGGRMRSGQTVIEIEGPLHSILKTERVLLNLIAHLSGVATSTHCFVQAVKGTRAKVLDTRKTTPLWRELEKAAVVAGGGVSHRYGLDDYILVKENHRRFGAMKRLKKTKSKFEIEVRNLEELSEAIDLGAEVAMLDHFTPSQIKKAVTLRKSLKSRVYLEASGNVSLKNIKALAQAGVDSISIGSLTHSVKSHDFSLLVV